MNGRQGRLPHRLGRSLALPLILLLCGCNADGGKKLKLFDTRTPREAMLVALSDEPPDVRREAVERVATSNELTQDWAVDGMVTIALLEQDPQTRVAAVRALGEIDDARAVEACRKILTAADHPPSQVRPPPGVCRWAAAESIGLWATRANADDAARPGAMKAILATLRADTDRNVRITSARAAAGFPDLTTVRGLIAALDDDDFAVAHASEYSLAYLTGQALGCNRPAWEEWLKVNESTALANGGQLPPERRPPYDNAFEERMYKSRQTMWWLFPGRKASSGT